MPCIHRRCQTLGRKAYAGDDRGEALRSSAEQQPTFWSSGLPSAVSVSLRAARAAASFACVAWMSLNRGM